MPSLARRTFALLACGLVGLLATATAATAGDLNPPPGPVSSTMKPLDEVEPRTPVSLETTPGDAFSVYRIATSGSYYLTGNKDLVAVGRAGILIDADGVTLDLSGFRLRRGLGASLAGIEVESGRRDVMIRNGTISNWTGRGIDMSAAVGCIVEDVRVSDCGDYGIIVGAGCAVRRCVAVDNELSGFHGSSAAVLSDCVSKSNNYGVTGNFWEVCDVVAEHNTLDGINLNGFGLVTNCAAAFNERRGISVGTSCSVVDCSAVENGEYGILATQSVVSRCNAAQNGLDGFRIGSGVRASGNHAVGNGQSTPSAGYSVVGNDALLSDNSAEGNAIGVEATGTGCVIIRNVAQGNTTNYSIGPSNDVGPIGTAAAATSPMANVSF